MNLEYTIKYDSENRYDPVVSGARWVFLIEPENSATQQLLGSKFKTGLPCSVSEFENIFRFNSYMVKTDRVFQSISFSAEYKVLKKVINPFDFTDNDQREQYDIIDSLDFRVDHNSFLQQTALTVLPADFHPGFKTEKRYSIFTNLQQLNTRVHQWLEFQPEVTNTSTTLAEVLILKKGVCQDYSHLFCGLSRTFGIPCRYVSGYLHQGQGFSGDLQMHAWIEAFIPHAGWIGFDPTNNILCDHHHIKIAHGRDYKDCAPITGIVFGKGDHKTSYRVQVAAQQQ